MGKFGKIGGRIVDEMMGSPLSPSVYREIGDDWIRAHTYNRPFIPAQSADNLIRAALSPGPSSYAPFTGGTYFSRGSHGSLMPRVKKAARAAEVAQMRAAKYGPKG